MLDARRKRPVGIVVIHRPESLSNVHLCPKFGKLGEFSFQAIAVTVYVVFIVFAIFVVCAVFTVSVAFIVIVDDALLSCCLGQLAGSFGVVAFFNKVRFAPTANLLPWKSWRAYSGLWPIWRMGPANLVPQLNSKRSGYS
ncbi:MAG: hypothetical protein AAF329_08565 [Cyanobacteria bacterium P01_A01_bin.17]